MAVDTLPQAEGPALSATSETDFPTVTPAETPVAAAPALSESAKPVADAPVVPAVAAETPEALAAAKVTADAKVVTDAATAKAATDAAVEKRAEHATARKAAEESARVANEGLRQALALVDRLTKQDNETKLSAAAAADPRPKRDTFDTPDAYDTALEDWAIRGADRKAAARVDAEKAEATAREASASAEKAGTDKAAAEQSASIVADWTAKATAAKTEFPDFDEVVNKPETPISVPMAHAIIAAENGPAIAYHFGKNPAEAARISALNPVQAMIEIGRLSATLGMKPAVTVSKAPDPITPLASASERATTKTADEETAEEYFVRRNGEIKAARAARYN
jgi:hypothetical protein